MLTLNPSEDIKLKVIEESDAEAVYNSIKSNRKRLREWLSWLDKINSLADYKRLIPKVQENCRNGQAFLFGIFYQNEFAGIIDLKFIDTMNKKTSIGYWLDQKFEGKGIMTKSVKALVNFAFTTLQLNRIEITAAVNNEKSNKVVQNAGFVKEGVLRENEWLYDHFEDHNVYSILKSEWKS